MARIRYAIRSLAKAPLLSLVVLLSLGLGIGANTAIFSLLHQLVLSSLPVPHPEELVLLTSPGEFKGGRNSTNDAGDMDYIFNFRTLREIEKNSAGIPVAGFRLFGANLAYGHQTVNGSVLAVSGQYFPVLGVQPIVGRTLNPTDDQGAGNPVAVLSYGFWHDKLAGDTAALNRPIRVNGNLFTIVGVTPRSFTGTTLGDEPSVFVPIALKPLLTLGWDGTNRLPDYWIYMIARLKAGMTRPQAEAVLNAPYHTVVEEIAKVSRFRDDNRRNRFLGAKLTLKPGQQGNSSTRDSARTPLTILMIATVLVLLIAMANAANLLLARSAERRKELAIRSAMGASRSELVWQMLTEALLLAAAGGACGLVFAAITLRFLISQLSDETAVYFVTPTLNWPVLLFGLGVSLATGLLFGLYPAWDAARNTVASTLSEATGRSSSSAGATPLRKVLVCAQVTISAVLLIPTGLFLKSLVNLMHVDLGIRTENVIGFAISPELNGYKPEASRALFERAEQDLTGIPGVRGVAASLVPLIAGNNWGNGVRPEGAPKDAQYEHSMYNEIGTGFFSVMGVPLISGREFTLADNLAAPKVAVVNQTFANHIFPGRNPLGLKFSSGDPGYLEVVGVVKDSHYSSVKQKVPNVYYTPWRQDKGIGSMDFYVRTALPPEQIIPQIRRVMASIDRDLPTENLRTLDEQIRINIRSDRMVLQLSAAFAVLATLLAMLGLYGVMAHSVFRRTREIGIRMALGAGPGLIRSMVMREMLWILLLGLATGIPAALVLSRFAESQLFGVKTDDITVVVIAAMALAATTAAAGYLPARRAAHVNPLEALRWD